MSGRTPDHSVRVPVNFQNWEHLTFLHWSYDVAAVQRLVPKALTVQAWDGITWVGLTPFRMAQVRPPVGPPPPGWGAFAELNVRAYVRAPNGRDGIWFLGMLVPRLSFVAALRTVGLPYQRSHALVTAHGSRLSYRFGTPQWRRPPANDWFQAVVQVGPRLAESQRTPLLDSLTGRWSALDRKSVV